MKNIITFLFVMLIVASCSHKKADRPSSTTSTVNTEKKFKEFGDTRAVFHIISPLGVELALFHIESKKEVKVHVDKTLSQVELPEGHWEVRGFVLKGKSYKMMKTSKQFVLNVKKNKKSYVGSYIFQCPKVDQSHIKELKKLSFFNRYPYSSNTGLCELVVGSDYEKVNKVWLGLKKDQTPLTLGF
jgi:hypothetical protein